MQKSGLEVSDGLWLGCETIPKEGGLCVNTIQIYPDGENGPDDYSILEIHDLAEDPRFKDRDYVLNYPKLRFYAGTPLRTKRGYNIGSLCVVDSSPRTLTTHERQTLGRMGQLVMRHLELTAETRALRRNQRMAESLGRFVARKHGPLDSDSDAHSFVHPSGVINRPPRSEPKRPALASRLSGSSASMLDEVFTRASVLIRDALMTDGVVFVDADRAYNISPLARRDSTTRLEQISLSRRRRTGVLGVSMSMGWGGDEREEEADIERGEPGDGMVLSDSTIQRMLELYPQGTILSFDEMTPPTASLHMTPDMYPAEDGFPFKELPAALSEEEQIFQEVRQFLPDSAAVLFLPLFHLGGKAYAASFSWTSDVRRVFTYDELSYMQGFMSSIMAEVSRLNTLSTDKAKGEFISSISHELRSPLHGVLASAEFLADTTLDAFQRSFVDTVETCGRMLLDTINHVLDFSKLNSLMQNQRAQIAARDNGPPNHDHSKAMHSYGSVVSLIESIDISLVTEQVIDSVYAGYEFKGILSPIVFETASTAVSGSISASPRDEGLLSNNSGTSVPRSSSHRSTETLTVILDIEKRDDWSFVTQPGAVRRILMNIFGTSYILYTFSFAKTDIYAGNALKYTNSGWIRVQLRANDLPPGEDGELKSKVTFTISDSGRGITQEFLKSKLFTPFCQEDTLASGTGLGMSIVRQIVQLLGGDIKVQSEVDVGTEVSVALILKRGAAGTKKSLPSLEPGVADHSEGRVEQPALSTFDHIREYTVGKTICFCGFDPSDLAEPPSLPSSPAQIVLDETTASLYDSLAQYAHQWYGMHVIHGTLASEDADILLAHESPELMQYLQKKSTTSSGPTTPLIVLCSNVSRYQVYAPKAGSRNIFDFTSKPSVHFYTFNWTY